jgi:hypothetical protein
MFNQFLEDKDAESQTREKEIVENSFWLEAEKTGIKISRENINYMDGWPVWIVFETLCNKLLPYAKENEIQKKVEESYSIFKKNLKLS